MLGNVAGGIGQSEALAINNNGQSVGFALTSSRQDAVMWSSSGTVTVLKDAGGQGNSAAVAIDAKGQSVGYSETATGQDAVFWSPKGKSTVLTDLGGQSFDEALAMNNAGRSVGFSITSSGQDAVLWSSTGAATKLQDLGGEGFDEPTAINASGQSVGYTLTASGDDAVVWSSSGVATDLGAVLGSAWTNTIAVGLNNNGEIIGYGDYNGRFLGFCSSTPPPPLPPPSFPHGACWLPASRGSVMWPDADRARPLDRLRRFARALEARLGRLKVAFDQGRVERHVAVRTVDDLAAGFNFDLNGLGRVADRIVAFRVDSDRVLLMRHALNLTYA